MLWPNIFACFNGDKPSLSCTVDFLVAVSRACNIMNTILKSSRCGMSLSSCTYSMHLLTQTLPSRTRTRVSVAGLDIDCSRRGVVPEWHPGNINWHFHLPHKRKDQPAGPCTVAASTFITFIQSFHSLSHVSHLARFQTWPLSHLHRALLHECSRVVRIQLWCKLDWDCHQGTPWREEQTQ